MKAWNLQSLALQLPKDLAQCQSESERINCKAFFRMDMKETARRIRNERKLTPGEHAILEEHGLEIDVC